MEKHVEVIDVIEKTVASMMRHYQFSGNTKASKKTEIWKKTSNGYKV
jgi:hypothetical protein